MSSLLLSNPSYLFLNMIMISWNHKQLQLLKQQIETQTVDGVLSLWYIMNNKFYDFEKLST